MGCGAKTSASGYIVPRLSLARRGLDVQSLFGEETFVSSHGAVAFAVRERRADVGATYAVFEAGDPKRKLMKAGFLDYMPEMRARLVDVAGPIPSDMIVATAAVSTLARAAFAGALSALVVDPRGAPPIRALIGAEDFRPFSHASVQELQALLDAGTAQSPTRE